LCGGRENRDAAGNGSALFPLLGDEEETCRVQLPSGATDFRMTTAKPFYEKGKLRDGEPRDSEPRNSKLPNGKQRDSDPDNEPAIAQAEPSRAAVVA
jgi:hypothetical protein